MFVQVTAKNVGVFFWDTVYIIMRPRAGWAGLICRTRPRYHCQWLSNTEWSNSRWWPEVARVTIP